MEALFKQAVELLAEGRSFVYAAVISENGSTPRSAGAKMLILKDRIYDTIGGGAVEGDVIALARNDVFYDHQPRIKAYDMSGAQAADADLICGGTGEVLLDYIDASDPNNQLIFQKAAEAAKAGQEAWLVTILDQRLEAPYPRQFFLAMAGGEVIGVFHETEYLDKAAVCSPMRGGLHGEVVPDVRFIADPIQHGGVIYLFGAGHVSKEVAGLAKRVGFQVVVLDDRSEFANSQRFPGCKVRVIDSFEHLPQLPIDEKSYILIITRGHLYDSVVLEWALRTKAYYIGMIGSKSKRDKIYAELEKQGFSREQLAEVCSPIGLKIGAETPEEIAVSIIAELIQKRAQQKKAMILTQ